MKTTLCLLLLLPVVSSYNTKLIGRRTALVGLVSSVVTPASAVVSSKPCVSGVGEGCAELSEGNAYIQSLQAKSAENKEKNARVSVVVDIAVSVLTLCRKLAILTT